jgi:broad specificity phosphatase PhoE
MTRSVGLVRFAAAAAVTMLACMPAVALDAIYIVRHGEKVGFWPGDPSISAYIPLSDEGIETSRLLADALGDAGVAAIYGSRTTRSLATAMPLAEKTGAPVMADDATTDPDQMDAFLAEVNGRHAADRAILVIGHSNTVADFLVRLGAEQGCFDRLGVTEDRGRLQIRGYGDLWRIRIAVEGCGGIERLRLTDEAD